VQVTYAIENCPQGEHQTHIHEGTGCASTAQQGMHWGPTRGENIGPTGMITCDAQMRGALVYTRPSTNATTRWTIGDGATSDILGHPVVVHGLSMNDRHGCGVIQAL
jgi:superoxide dismutase, Cu-Zn family